MLKLPKCRHCNRSWLPCGGAVASRDFCGRCCQERRDIAKAAFDLHPITAADHDGIHLIPRSPAHRQRKGGPPRLPPHSK